MCGEEKSRRAFIKEGDVCTKCRNTETNPLCLKRGSLSTWSSVSPLRKPDPYMSGRSPNRLLTTSQSGSSIINSSRVSQLPNSPHSEEKNPSLRSTPHGGSLNTKTLEHKIDLILESALEMERNQIQVAAIRTEMHKFLVELSHLNNNVAVEDDEKYSGLESLTVTIEQRFLQTHREISTLQETISSLKGEITNSKNIQRGTLDEIWRVELDRREQIWQARMIEERKVWNERLLEERKQWQQSLEQQNTQLQRTLQEGISQLRQEFQKSNSERHAVIQNRTPEISRIVGHPAASPSEPSSTINTPPIGLNTQGSSQTSLSQSKAPGLGATSIALKKPPTSHSSATSANPASISSLSLKPKPPNIIIKRSVVKI